MAPERFVLIRHSGLRTVTEQEVLDTLSTSDLSVPREVISVDTSTFADDVTAGDWSRSYAYLSDAAASIRERTDRDPRAVELRYFGLAEIPHVTAFGALLGDERSVRVFDYDRQQDSWRWATDEPTLTLHTTPLPVERLTQPGIAVIRVSISAAIDDVVVEAVIGRENLADITIAPAGGTLPQVGLVRSAADVDHARTTFRSAISALVAARPGVEVIHLFLAAPVSVCFVIGQELRLRNMVPIQTYRFRRMEHETSYIPALRLSATADVPTSRCLTPEEATRANHVRDIFATALAEVKSYANDLKGAGAHPGAWYEALRLGKGVIYAQPFPSLPPLHEVVDLRDEVDPEPFDGEYGHDKDVHRWRLGDRLLLAMADTAGDDESLQQLVQLFLFHEYLHEYNALTKYTALDVGSFPNCLEHIDYTADLYALLHQLGWAMIHRSETVRSAEQQCEFLAGQLDITIRSFWSFDQPLPREQLQVRRLRRYLNWYWRHVQIKRATPDLAVVLAVLSRRPAIELAGMRLLIRAGRTFVDLTKRLPGENLSLALVLEDERLMRISDSVVTNLAELLIAFGKSDHSAIQRFFNSVYEEAKNWGGSLPKVRT